MDDILIKSPQDGDITFTSPVTGSRIFCDAPPLFDEVHELADAPATIAKRGYHDEITSILFGDGVALSAAEIIRKFVDVLPETFVAFDRRMRGDSLNLDLYGYDIEQDVAVIQIRHFFRRYRNGYANIHKDYVLVGRNEITNELFRHPVSAHAVHAGIRRDDQDPVAAVRAAQRWMWGVSDKQLARGIRQGDILIVPAKSKPAHAEMIEADTVLVGGTHEVHAPHFAETGKGWFLPMAQRCVIQRASISRLTAMAISGTRSGSLRRRRPGNGALASVIDAAGAIMPIDAEWIGIRSIENAAAQLGSRSYQYCATCDKPGSLRDQDNRLRCL